MKRPHASFKEGSDSEGASDNDAFDDGDDLMARAASMMDFDDEDDSEDDEDSEAGSSSSEAGPSTEKKQKLNSGRQKGKRHEQLEALPEDDEAELQSVLQLQVSGNVIAATILQNPADS